MGSPPSPTQFPLTFHDDRSLLAYTRTQGRVDYPFDGGVTLSAVPNPSGETIWEARNADGEMLRSFGLIYTAQAGVIITEPASGDVPCYYCYEDNIKQKTICIKMRCFNP